MGVLPQSMTELIAPLEQRGRNRTPARNRDNNRDSGQSSSRPKAERLFVKGTDIAKRIERELLEDFQMRATLARLNRAFAGR